MGNDVSSTRPSSALNALRSKVHDASPRSSNNKSMDRRTKHYKRRALHAGSWYSNDPTTLEAALERFVSTSSSASTTTDDNGGGCGGGVPRAVVAPHAGYDYSGETAGCAYAALREAAAVARRIVVLHPSHHVRLEGCAVSGARVLETPLGDLTVDDALRTELAATGEFETMEKRDDENEHSAEMQYPLLYKALSSSSGGDVDATVLPIMVGHLDDDRKEFYGRILAPILARPDVFTIVSTDFCHWGDRFRFSPFDDKKFSKIYEYIECLDSEGMQHICQQDPGAFVRYIRRTRNTICGRYPIEVWLHAVRINSEENRQTLDVKFVRYAQSSKVEHAYESSVSYASAVARLRS